MRVEGMSRMAGILFRLLAGISAVTLEAGMDMENGHALLRQVASDDRRAEESVLSTGSLEELKAKQSRWRELWLDMLGGLPEKTPLEPQVTGRIPCDGFTVEKILFQSMPGVYVTGYLYLPEDPEFRAPYPALLLVCGHSDDGKLRDRYCHMAVMAVKEGFAVFTPDPYSQGERIQRSADYSLSQCAEEHASLGARSWLVGWNFARFRIWDAVRSVDYMETRPELDLSKLAVAGCSGGGTMSTYMQAFDDRIRVACPSCYVSSLREVIGERGVHDAEQFFFGQLPRGFNHAVLLAMGQPRTAVMLDTRHEDYFPIAGARSTAALMEQFQKKLGIDTPFAIFSSDGPHGLPLCGRTAILSWLKYAVKGEESRYCRKGADGKPELDVEALRQIPDVTPPIPFPEEGRTVTASGQVRDLPGFKSLYTLIAEEALRLRKTRRIDRAALPEIVRRRAGIHTLADLPSEPEPFMHDFKWWYLSGAEGVSVELHAAILAVEGRSLVGERAESFLRKALAEREANGGKPVPLKAEGVWCIPAAHAFAAEPELFSEVEFTDPPKSWTEMLCDPDPGKDSFAVTVWGALKEYDWIDLVPKDRLTIHRTESK